MSWATFLEATTWILPLLIAIPFHEASHGFVAHRCGDDTAWRLGRVTFNPLRHIDPFGTIILPLLLFMNGGFLFGYAKPVPVDFRALRHPRIDSVYVAAAGPAMNVALAVASGYVAYALPFFPKAVVPWLEANIVNSIDINVVLAVFNMLPLPPLDGGRIAVGLLPRRLALPLARIEPYGLPLLLLLIFVLPQLGKTMGVDLNVIAWLLGGPVDYVLHLVGLLTGLGDALQ